METTAGIPALVAWRLLFGDIESGVLEEPHADYAGMLEGMEAADLLSLMEMVQERLRKLGPMPVAAPPTSPAPATRPVHKPGARYPPCSFPPLHRQEV